MATIKVKLRPSSVAGRAGTVYYQVTHRRATQQITTNIRLQPDEWDAIGEQVVVSVADKSIIQNRIDSDIALLKRIVKDLDNSGVTYSVGDIIKRYKSPECHVSVLDFMKNQIRLMRNANRLGTALNYEKTMKNFAEFLGGVNLPFSAMTEQLIADTGTTMKGKSSGGMKTIANCLCTYTVPRFCISKMLRYAMPSSMIIP